MVAFCLGSLVSRGQFGPRDFNRVVFTLPIPLFDPNEPLHRELAEAGEHAETVAAAVALPEGTRFQQARALVRTALIEDGVAGQIDRIVEELLAPAPA